MDFALLNISIERQFNIYSASIMQVRINDEIERALFGVWFVNGEWFISLLFFTFICK